MNDIQTSSSKQDVAGWTGAIPAFIASRRGSEPAWLTKAREDALASFVERGLPTRKLEAWRYFNVRPIAQATLAQPAGIVAPSPSVVGTYSVAEKGTQPIRAVLVDGRICKPLCSLDSLPPGAKIEALSDILGKDPERLRSVLTAALPADHVFAALNVAAGVDGIAITIDSGVVVDRPIEILSLTSGGGIVHHPRFIISLGRAAQARLVETHANVSSTNTSGSLANVLVDVCLADGAILEHVKIGDGAAESFHVAATRVDQKGRDCSYRSLVVSLGELIHRHSLYVTLLGQGASCDLNGLYMLNGAQAHDHYTVIDHAVPHTTSSEHYKGVFDGKSRGTFFGRILVRKDAQKTASSQENNNLLISNEALCNSTPQLEILADDVKCAHGSTIGQLEDTALFYLRSRGIDVAAARELLTYAFANEILDRLTIEPLRERLARRLTREPDAAHIETNED